ncbi:MAG: response regulator [Candidatus Woesearchaeota archaeon]|nr:response regulator [Candidatus Woesearchaeota archaeon]
MAKILIVENDADLTFMYVTRFGSMGHDVLAASTIDDGIKMYDEQNPDLIISDYRFNEKTGKDLFNYVREGDKKNGRHTPFILVSGKEREFKPDKFLMKPFDGKDLCNVVDTLLKNKHLSQK